MNDVGRQKIASVGNDRVGERRGGRTVATGAGGFIPAVEVAEDPVVVVLIEALLGEFTFGGDLQDAAVEWHERDRRIHGGGATEFVAAFTLGVFPRSNDAQSEFLARGDVLVEDGFLAGAVVDLVGQRAERASELRELADVVDDATGITLAEEYGRGSLDDLNALDGVEVVGGVAEDAVTHEAVHDETAHREGALRSGGVGRNTHGETGVAGCGRGVAEQIGERAGVRVIEELARDNGDVHRDLLDLHADLRGGGGVGLEVAVVFIGFDLERAERLHAFIGLHARTGSRSHGTRCLTGGLSSGSGGLGGAAFERGEALAEGGIFVLELLQGVVVGCKAHGG